MVIEIRRRKRVCIVSAKGRLVLEDGEGGLLEACNNLLAGGERRLVINLDGLELIDSAGVGEIVACYQSASAAGALVRIALRPGGVVRRVFRVSGLERAREVYDDEDQAVDSYS
jgi:anti-anti-sigma factor